MLDTRRSYQMILGLIQTNDWGVFEEVARAHPDDFPVSKLAIYLEIGDTLSRLIGSYDFTESPAFHRALLHKSPAYIEAKRKFESEPLKSLEHRNRFIAALLELPISEDAFDLLSSSQHEDLKRIKAYAVQLFQGD